MTHNISFITFEDISCHHPELENKDIKTVILFNEINFANSNLSLKHKRGNKEYKAPDQTDPKRQKKCAKHVKNR